MGLFLCLGRGRIRNISDYSGLKFFFEKKIKLFMDIRRIKNELSTTISE
jgi:hypothetical protein